MPVHFCPSITITHHETFDNSIGGDASITLNLGPAGAVNVPLGGISQSWGDSVTLNTVIGGEGNTRWRAYPVYPVAKAVLTGFYDEHNGLTVSTPIKKDLGTAVIAGKGWYKQAACCDGSE